MTAIDGIGGLCPFCATLAVSISGVELGGVRRNLRDASSRLWSAAFFVPRKAEN